MGFFRQRRSYGPPPFSDLGKTRFIRFSALGTDWTLESANDSQSVRAAERLAAAAQALLAALAGEDLCIMPTRVTVLIEARSPLTRDARRVIEALPSNDGRLWKVHLAPITDSKVFRSDEITSDLLAVLTQILFEASLLPEADFMVIIERAFQRGIGHKLSPARPYDELAAEFSDERCTEMRRDRLVAPWDLLGGPYTAHADLGWQQGPGPTFSSDKAKRLLQTRYANLASSLRKTLRALKASAAFRGTVDSLRDEGWLDWHILTSIFNIVMNHRLDVTAQDVRRPSSRAEIVRLALEPEKELARNVPEDLFTRDEMHRARWLAMVALLERWELECHQKTPDFPGIERLLAARYGYWEDDIQHDDLL